MRGIPIFTFMNKLDRDGREPLDLVNELEEVLGIDAYPMNWPIVMGKGLAGLYDIYNNRIELHTDEPEYLALDSNGELKEPNPIEEESVFQDAMMEVDLMKEAGNQFDEAKIARVNWLRFSSVQL